MFFTCLYNVCKKVRMQCVTNSGKNHLVTKFRCCYQPWDEPVKFLFFTDFALQSNSKSRILLHHWREDNGKQSSAAVAGFSFAEAIGHLGIISKLRLEI